MQAWRWEAIWLDPNLASWLFSISGSAGVCLDSPEHAAVSQGCGESYAGFCKASHILEKVKIMNMTHFQFHNHKLEVAHNHYLHSHQSEGTLQAPCHGSPHIPGQLLNAVLSPRMPRITPKQLHPRDRLTVFPPPPKWGSNSRNI